jgi:hypothetical protein
LLALIAIRRGGAATDGHPIAIGDQMNQNPFAFAAIGNPLTTTLARGKKSRLRLHTPNESVPSPEQY